MLRVYRGLGTFNGRYQLQAWVARIATNVSLDMVRARSRRPQRDPVTPDISENARLVVALTDDPSEAVERVLDQEEIRAILSEIPDHHREALVLREFEGRSHEEIGEALGVSPQQAKALIHRAKKSFRRAWDRSGERRGVAALAPIIFLSRVPDARVPPQAVAARARRGGQRDRDGAAGGRDGDGGAGGDPGSRQHGRQGHRRSHHRHRGRHRQRGRGDPAHAEAVEADAGDRVAGAGSRGAPAIVVAPPVQVEAGRQAPPQGAPQAGRSDAGGQGQTGTVVPVETPTDSPSPTDPSPTPGPVTPPPPPPAPAWTGAFTTSGGLAAASLSQISQHVTGPHNDQLLFGEVMQGALVDKHGDAVGTVYLDFGGSIAGGSGSLSSLWLWIDTPEGQYKYAAARQPPVGDAGGRRLDHVRLRGRASASRACPRRSIHRSRTTGPSPSRSGSGATGRSTRPASPWTNPEPEHTRSRATLSTGRRFLR